MPLRRAAIAGALLPFALALLALAAWATGALRLASVRAEYIPMAPSTAIGFVLVGAACIALSFDAGPLARMVVRGAAGVVTLLALINLLQFFTGAAALNLEALLVAQPGSFGDVPLARMSPLTAAGFLLAGPALARLAAAHPGSAPPDAAGALAGFITVGGATVGLGYLFNAPLLYGGRIIPMALTTGVAFIGTGIAMMSLAGSRAFPLRPFSGSSAGARLLRVFLPLTAGAVLATAVLTDLTQRFFPANPALVAAVLAMGAAAASGATVSWMARALGGAIDRAELVMRESRDELERRVSERTADLSALNHELESFSYSVSHDLRAPLRHVLGFATLLQHKSGADLDSQGRHYLASVIQAAERMGRLIDDLLALSRTTRTALRRQLTSLDAVVREAQSEVLPLAAGRRIAWRLHEGLPEVGVDPALFRLVFVNLLSNAIKYTAPRPTAEIEVGTDGQRGRRGGGVRPRQRRRLRHEVRGQAVRRVPAPARLR